MVCTIYCKYRTPHSTTELEDTPIMVTDISLADNEAYHVHVHVQESHIPLTNTEVYYINIQETDIPVVDNEAYDMRTASTNIATNNEDLLYDEIVIIT